MWLYLKKNFAVVIMILILLAVGTFFVVLPGLDFIRIFSVILALYLTGAAVYIFILALRSNLEGAILNNRAAAFAAAAGLLTLAVLTVIFPRFMVLIVIFLVFIATPTITLFVRTDRKAYFRKNFWKYILGAVLLLSVKLLVDIAFIIVGIIFYGLACFLIYLLIAGSRLPEKPNLVDKYLVRYLILLSKKKK